MCDVRYLLMLGFCKSIASLPDKFLYGGFHRFLYFVIYRVARYRVAVVRDNLSKCFPEKSAEERHQIELDFYNNFSEWIVDIFRLTKCSAERLSKDLLIENPEMVDAEHNPHGSIALVAHYGCWEYFSAYPAAQYGLQIVAAYHALEDSAVDKLLYYIRRRFGAMPVEQYDILRFCVRYHNGYDGKQLFIGLVSDQTPAKDVKHHWLKFMGRPTVFVRGGEHMAVRLGLPVYYAHVTRVGVGRYSFRAIPLYDGHEQVEEYEIMERYAALLEQQIRECPSMWLWSHRRWKRPFRAEAQADYYARYPEDKPNEN